jgi:hypothetical protein
MDNIIYDAEAQLDKLQLQTFSYFWNEANPEKGLVAEKTAPDWPASTAVTGLALTGFPVAVERGFISRRQAAERTLSTLRFFLNSKHGPEPEATGYHGFYYHLLDMQNGRRARVSELSTFDTAILLAGALAASCYFDNENSEESEIREIAEILYRRADWKWALCEGKSLKQEWRAEKSFSEKCWNGFDQALLIQILALGSPTYPVSPDIYDEWTTTFKLTKEYGFEYIYAGPLFIHQIPHAWLDLRGIHDKFMNEKGFDYFENTTRATYVHRQYAIDNPGRFEGYNKNCWGFTVSDGPGPGSMNVKGEEILMLGDAFRGAPSGPDDGTISPWAAVCSIPFAPGIVIPAIDYYFHETNFLAGDSYGFRSSYNPSFPHKSYNPYGWKSPWHTGLNQGPALPLIENYRTGLIWNLMKESPYIIQGLKKAGFEGGWLSRIKTESEIFARATSGR